MNTSIPNVVNQELRTCYETWLPTLNAQIDLCIQQCNWPKDQVSKVFTMSVDDAYLEVSPKIMFVGRETAGWHTYDSSDKVDNLMQHYVDVKDRNHNSPFWWFRKRFSDALGIGEQFRQATLWTNLCKIDVNKTKPTGRESFGQLSQLFITLLLEEIRITKPDVVLIMTTDGHYNWHLNNYDWIGNSCYDPHNLKPNSLHRQPLLSGKIEQLAVESVLPKHTYQIPHPNYLYKKGIADEVLNELTQQILAKATI
ncbi:MAG: hypothetical protein EAZ91_15515 [Cytophagales bacterium]|nr:MAG: hypothetical protein EAZ91_15515 [Cytophagales bacterium]